MSELLFSRLCRNDSKRTLPGRYSTKSPFLKRRNTELNFRHIAALSDETSNPTTIAIQPIVCVSLSGDQFTITLTIEINSLLSRIRIGLFGTLPEASAHIPSPKLPSDMVR
jgi:hypothetical protein